MKVKIVKSDVSMICESEVACNEVIYVLADKVPSPPSNIQKIS